MPLKIQYSLELEKQRIKNAIDKLSWYEKLGYKPRFPQNINPKTDSLEKIYKALQNEYIEKDYKTISINLAKDFANLEDYFFSNLEKLCGKKINRTFQLILTRYGVGGSYSLPNKILYNFEMSYSSINIILHEIVHLVIEPYILKYQIEQNKKERVVDLILKSELIALSNYEMQKRGEKHSNLIDPIFKQYFKAPIEYFFKKI